MRDRPETCPNCGENVPAKAHACPHCGADEHTGWAEEAEAGGLDLPEEEFDYDRFIENEFGRGQVKAAGLPWFWWLIGIGLVTLFAIGLIRG